MQELFGLSEREVEVLGLLGAGASNKEIASHMGIKTNTVKVHLRNIYAKLNVNSRHEAVMLALRNNLVNLDDMESDSNPQINQPDNRRSFSNRGIERPERGTLAWYLMLALVGFLFVTIMGMMILLLQGQNRVRILPPPELENQRWQALTDLPTGRRGLAVTAFENQIYAIGGETAYEITGSVERFDPQTNTWAQLADKPLPVKDVQAVVIGGLIYVPGGRNRSGEISTTLEVFNPRTEQWWNLAPLPVGLSAYASVAFEGKLYIFGGWDGEKYVNTVFSYDPQSDLWSEATPMVSPRAYARAEVSGDAIYVMGGVNDAGTLDINVIYLPQYENTEDSPWQERSPMPEGRFAFGMIGVADILHIVGGVGTDGPPLPYKYFPQEDRWQSFSPPKEALTWSHLGITAIESHLYILGGQIKDKLSSEILAYQAIYTITMPLVK